MRAALTLLLWLTLCLCAEAEPEEPGVLLTLETPRGKPQRVVELAPDTLTPRRELRGSRAVWAPNYASLFLERSKGQGLAHWKAGELRPLRLPALRAAGEVLEWSVSEDVRWLAARVARKVGSEAVLVNLESLAVTRLAAGKILGWHKGRVHLHTQGALVALAPAKPRAPQLLAKIGGTLVASSRDFRAVLVTSLAGGTQLMNVEDGSAKTLDPAPARSAEISPRGWVAFVSAANKLRIASPQGVLAGVSMGRPQGSSWVGDALCLFSGKPDVLLSYSPADETGKGLRFVPLGAGERTTKRPLLRSPDGTRLLWTGKARAVVRFDSRVPWSKAVRGQASTAITIVDAPGTIQAWSWSAPRVVQRVYAD